MRKAVYAGWNCTAGPSELVDYLIEDDWAEQVDFEDFAKAVDLSTAPLDQWQIELLPTDWHVTWLKTKLPSGQQAWVMQHSGIEFLFLTGGFDHGAEARAAVAWSEAVPNTPIKRKSEYGYEDDLCKHWVEAWRRPEGMQYYSDRVQVVMCDEEHFVVVSEEGEVEDVRPNAGQVLYRLLFEGYCEYAPGIWAVTDWRKDPERVGRQVSAYLKVAFGLRFPEKEIVRRLKEQKKSRMHSIRAHLLFQRELPDDFVEMWVYKNGDWSLQGRSPGEVNPRQALQKWRKLVPL